MNQDSASRLQCFKVLVDNCIISKSMHAILKNQLILENENLHFICKQFESSKSTFERFIDSINSFIEREVGYLFDALYAKCSLVEAKELAKHDREVIIDNKLELTADAVVPNKRHMEMSLTYGEI